MTEPDSIEKLLENGDFDGALKFCEDFPDEIKKIDPSTGATVLHLLCRQPPAPIILLEKVLELFPDAVRLQENLYQATPLHLLAWTSQRTSSKVKAVLEYMNEEDMFLRNRFGGTALHSACGSQASIDVIELIYNKNPKIVAIRTFEYNHTALTALWQSHLQSIQGHMQIAQILEGKEVRESHFDRFFEKVKFLARAAFLQSASCVGSIGDIDPSNYALHGLLELRAPLNALKVAIKMHPEWASYPNSSGDYPLHVVVETRPFRLKDVTLIDELIAAFPEGAKLKNNGGDCPLFIGVRGRMTWEEGLGSIVGANTDALTSLDARTGLYPFLLAASLGGRVAVNTAYCLLCTKPHLIKEAVLN